MLDGGEAGKYHWSAVANTIIGLVVRAIPPLVERPIDVYPSLPHSAFTAFELLISIRSLAADDHYLEPQADKLKEHKLVWNINVAMLWAGVGVLGKNVAQVFN